MNIVVLSSLSVIFCWCKTFTCSADLSEVLNVFSSVQVLSYILSKLLVDRLAQCRLNLQSSALSICMVSQLQSFYCTSFHSLDSYAPCISLCESVVVFGVFG